MIEKEVGVTVPKGARRVYIKFDFESVLYCYTCGKDLQVFYWGYTVKITLRKSRAGRDDARFAVGKKYGPLKG